MKKETHYRKETKFGREETRRKACRRKLLILSMNFKFS